MAKLFLQRPLCLLAGLCACVLCSCSSDGHFTLLGYSTRPNYDCCIRTVYVPIFENVTFQRNLEFELTRAVIREIEAKTPFKVVDARDLADTELIGKIVTARKGVITLNQLGEVRDSEAGIGVEVIWRDLRPGSTGTILSSDPKKEDVRDEPPQFGVRPPLPTLVSPSVAFVPELGGSIAAAHKQLADRAAVQIISMMERGW